MLRSLSCWSCTVVGYLCGRQHGIYSSYLIATTLLLWRRCRGNITFLPLPMRHNSADSPALGSLNKERQITLTNTANAPLPWEPWHIPGLCGVGLNAFVCCFLFVAWFFSFWPEKLPVTPSNMNYNCVLWGGIVLLSILYYVVQGKKEWIGPVIETDESDVKPDASLSS